MSDHFNHFRFYAGVSNVLQRPCLGQLDRGEIGFESLVVFSTSEIGFESLVGFSTSGSTLPPLVLNVTLLVLPPAGQDKMYLFAGKNS